MLPSRCLRCGAVSRDPLCPSCIDFLVAYRPLWLDPSLLPGPSLLDLLAPREVALLSTDGDRIEWRSEAHEPTPEDAVRLINLLELEVDAHPVISVGDAEVLHAFLGQARRSTPLDVAQRAALAALDRYLASREWMPPHLADEYRLRARALGTPSEEPGGVSAAVVRMEAPAEEAEELTSTLPEPPEEEAVVPEAPPPATESEAPAAAAPVEEETPAEAVSPAPVPVPEPAPMPEPPMPLPEPTPQPSPVPQPEPEPEPEEARVEAPPAPAPSEVMATLSAEIREMKEELQKAIAQEREDVQAWIRERSAAIEAKEASLREHEKTLEAEAEAVEAERASVTQRLQALEKDEARLQVLQFLDPVPGMTEDVARVLATAFPDMASLRDADAMALQQCQGVTPALAKAIRYELVPGEVEDEQHAIDLREEAQAFLEEGDYRAALTCYDRLLAEHPEDRVFWFDKAELHVLLDQPEEALQCYTRVLDLDRRNRQAWFERANLLFGMGRLADAVDALKEALRVEPRRTADIILKAEQLRRDRHANEAAILLQAVLDIDPGNGRAVLGLADTFLDLGDLAAAEGLFSRALGKEGRDPELLFRKGELLDRKGRWGAAIQFYNRALAMKWDLPEAWLAKGQVLLAHERAQEALECFEKALSFAPQEPASLAGKEAAEAMLRPLKIPLRKPAPPAPAEPSPEEIGEEPSDEEATEAPPRPPSSLAKALREAAGEGPTPPPEEREETGEIPPDFKSFIESIEPEREDTHVLLQLAELALESGDADMALLRYQQALDQDPRSAKGWVGKGTALQQLERYEEALAAYDRALELEPGNELATRWRETCMRHLRRGETP